MRSSTIPSAADSIGEQLRRRREAANAPGVHRLACGRRDPLDPIEPDRRGPSTYGMGPAELYRYGQRLKAQGWTDWEIAARLVDPRDLQRQLDEAAESDRICHPHLEESRV